ncbi:transposase family protein [Microcoleus sp. N3A4]
MHQNRPILVRDLSVFGRPVYLKIPRRQFYCANLLNGIPQKN